MQIMMFLSDIMIPLLIFLIIGYGLLCRHNIYEEFIEGAKDGFETVIGIMPTLIGLMVAVGILRASGFLECFSNVCVIFTEKIGFPSELLPLAVVKMFSSSAATGLLLDIYKEYGTDSLLGRMASIMLGSTETIFYTMSVYFMSVKIKKSRYTLAGALGGNCHSSRNGGERSAGGDDGILICNYLTMGKIRSIIKLCKRTEHMFCCNSAGWSSLEARRAHNPKVTGSNPVPATKKQ